MKQNVGNLCLVIPPRPTLLCSGNIDSKFHWFLAKTVESWSILHGIFMGLPPKEST